MRKIFICFFLNTISPFFAYGELLVSEYNLISEHRLLSESDAKAVAKKFNVELNKFPKILESDPQAVKLNAHEGQLIEIHRNDGTGNYLYYRYVVKA